MTSGTTGTSGALVLAVDVGGTDLKAEVVPEDPGGPALAAGTARTPHADGDATLAAVAELGRRVLDDLSPADRSRVDVAGVVVPGLVDPVGGSVRFAANLGWPDAHVAGPIAARLGLPLVLGHDVTAAGTAERRLGAGAGRDDLAVVVIGTGIAAVLFSGGRRLRGAPPSDPGRPWGQAGELGHVVVRPGGRRCGCGQDGCLESVASARAIARAYAERTGRVVTGAAEVASRLGADPDADAVWAEATSALADGLLVVTALLAPELVVVGGGLSRAGEALLGPVRAAMAERSRVNPPPELRTAALGARAGVLGAALLARSSDATRWPP